MTRNRDGTEEPEVTAEYQAKCINCLSAEALEAYLANDFICQKCIDAVFGVGVEEFFNGN